MEKAVYIRELKKLIKKYHPDLCQDKNLESLYNGITVKLNNALDKLKAGKNGPFVRRNEPDRQKEPEPDYACYKMGMRHYRAIHPDRFYKRNTDRSYHLKSYDEQLQTLNAIFISFNAAEFFFGRLIEEYPDSPWRTDAEDKLALLKKLYKRYEQREAEKNPETISADGFIQEMGLKIMF